MRTLTAPDYETSQPAVRQATLRLAAIFFPFGVGYYGLLSVLAIVLKQRFGSATLIGVSLVVFTVGDGLGGLAFSGLLHRWSYRRVMASSVIVSAAAFVGCAWVPQYLAMVALLLVAASGGSVFAILGRTLAAHSAPRPQDRHQIFSAIQVSANIGGAAGPAVFGMLLAYGRIWYPFPAAAAIYCCSAAVAVAVTEPGLRPAAVDSRWPVSRATIGRLARSGAAIRILCLVIVGSVLYRQFYSAFALQVNGYLGPNERAALFWGNALLVAGLQLPVSRIVGRLTGSEGSLIAVMTTGIAIFALSLGLMGMLPQAFTSALGVMVVFSLAETVYSPVQLTAMAGLSPGSLLESSNIRQLTWTAGSGAGVFLGGTVYLTFAQGGGAGSYWLVMSVATLTAALALLAWPRRKPPKGKGRHRQARHAGRHVRGGRGHADLAAPRIRAEGASRHLPPRAAPGRYPSGNSGCLVATR
jgi:predicted MFS family arabinose efflux permease